MTDQAVAPLGTPEEFRLMLEELVDELAPRRFAVCAEHGERADGELIGWGLSFEDGVLFCDAARSYIGRFSDTGSTLRLLARAGDRLHLIWLDRAPERG